MNQCKSCGANITPGAKFCTSCGTPVVEVAQSAPTMQTSTSEVPTFHAQTTPDVPVFGKPTPAPAEQPVDNTTPNNNEQPATDAAPSFNGQPTANATPFYNGQPMPSGAPVYNGQPMPNGTPVYNGQPMPSGAPVYNGQPMPSGAPIYNGQPMPNGYQQPYGAPAKKKLGGGAIAAIIAGLALFVIIIVLLLTQLFKKDDYTSPIEKFEKGINSHDTSKIIDAFPFSKEQASVASLLGSAIEDEFEDIVSVDIDITSTTHLSVEEISDLCEYNDFQSFTGIEYELTDGYKVKAHMVGIATNDSIDKDVEFTVCKWDGKWYIFELDD